MKKLLSALVVTLGILTATPSLAVESMLTPTGVLQWDKTAAFEGYTLLSPNLHPNVYLLDMQGNVVHTWKTAGNPGLYAELLPNGHLLRGLRIMPKIVPFGGISGAVQELDWDGNVVWEHKIYSPTNGTHHAYDRMPNGNTLIVAWQYKTYEEAIKKGRKPDTLPKKGSGHKRDGVEYDGFWEDYIVEVDDKGKEVWAWHSWDHIGKGADKLDINYILPIDNYYGDSDWLHINSVRYIKETNQLLIVSRNFGEVFLLDKATGKIVYRWGNPSTHGKGERPGFLNPGSQILFGPHDATWLGDGKVMLFDNGWQRPDITRSRVLELDTKTNKITWEYKALNGNSFYSAYQGSSQKLPNGNVLVTSTHTGHIFELTGDAKPRVVWEFVNPWTHKGPTPVLSEAYALDAPSDINIMGNFVHRAFRYNKDYPGLAGKDLSNKQALYPDAPNWMELYEKAALLKAAEIK